MILPFGSPHRRRQGAELELRAALPNSLWMSVAAAFNDVRKLSSDVSFWTLQEGDVVKDRPRLVYDLGFGYRGKGGSRASLSVAT